MGDFKTKKMSEYNRTIIFDQKSYLIFFLMTFGVQT